MGAVVVYQDRVIARGRNRRETGKNALCHAELEAIDGACRALGGWRLWQCTLYVTLEPCPMCAGAIINARIPRLVFGARDRKAGSCGSVVQPVCASVQPCAGGDQRRAGGGVRWDTDRLFQGIARPAPKEAKTESL